MSGRQHPDPDPPLWPVILIMVGALVLVCAFWYVVMLGAPL